MLILSNILKIKTKNTIFYQNFKNYFKLNFSFSLFKIDFFWQFLGAEKGLIL